MTDFQTLVWEQEGHVATITLNRPEKLNAMSWTMFTEIGDAFERVACDPDIRCAVITGAGGAFCSGADLSDPANLVAGGAEFKERMRVIDGIVRSLIRCPKPTIAKVTGIAAGAGCNIALGCDLIVATTDASFAELFVKRGLVVDFGGTWSLSRLLPLNRAKELAFLGDTLTSREADRFGLLNRLCEPSEIDSTVKDLAQRLAAMPPQAIAIIKENLNRAAERTLEENLDAESMGQTYAFGTEDMREAVAAFVEKREPRFTGK